MKRWEPKALMSGNPFFDTCVYHQAGMDLLAEVLPVYNVLFASEMHGMVRCVDPDTGHYFGDTRRYIDANTGAGFAFPSQTVYVRRDEGPDKARGEKANLARTLQTGDAPASFRSHNLLLRDWSNWKMG